MTPRPLVLLSFAALFAFVPAVPSHAAPPSTGLVAYYPFDGNANDASGNGYHGTLHGPVPCADRYGVTGHAYAFDGINDWIGVARDNFVKGNDLTVSLWLRVAGANPPVQFVTCSDFSVFMNGMNVGLAISIPHTNSALHALPGTGLWVHFAGTYDGSYIRIYLNGTLAAKQLHAGTISDPDQDLVIGGLSGTYWQGELDDLRIYQRTLSNAEVQDLYSAEADGFRKWVYPTGDLVYASPALGADGTVHVPSMDGNLYALNPDGTLRWAFPTGGSSDSPAVGADGTIYAVGGSDLYAIAPDGAELWRYSAPTFLDSPVVDLDGTIYVGCYDGSLYAIHPEGTLKWTYPAGDEVHDAPAIGPDGMIYIPVDDYNSVEFVIGDHLAAIYPDGTPAWTFRPEEFGSCRTSPAVGADGTIYFPNGGHLYALDSRGTLKWAFPMGVRIESSPAVGPDGTIYLGSNDDHLYAINPDGTERWTFSMPNMVRSSPAVGADGTIFVSSDDQHLYAIRSDGTLGWEIDLESATHTSTMKSSPAIAADGTVYVGSIDQGIHAIQSGCGGLAEAPWPMYHRDVRHTARRPAGSPLTLVRMDHMAYGNGDTVTIDLSRLANLGSSTTAVELKMWMDWPGGGPIPFANAGASGSLVLPAGFDDTHGPIPLFTVPAALVRGEYAMGCRLLEPRTGGLLYESLAGFRIE